MPKGTENDLANCNIQLIALSNIPVPKDFE
jgi:hypothetical protein